MQPLLILVACILAAPPSPKVPASRPTSAPVVDRDDDARGDPGYQRELAEARRRVNVDALTTSLRKDIQAAKDEYDATVRKAKSTLNEATFKLPRARTPDEARTNRDRRKEAEKAYSAAKDSAAENRDGKLAPLIACNKHLESLEAAMKNLYAAEVHARHGNAEPALRCLGVAVPVLGESWKPPFRKPFAHTTEVRNLEDECKRLHGRVITDIANRSPETMQLIARKLDTQYRRAWSAMREHEAPVRRDFSQTMLEACIIANVAGPPGEFWRDEARAYASPQ